MPEGVTIRMATEADACAIAALYAPYVRDTAITFECEAPDAAEISRRIRITLERYPYFVAECGGRVVGYCYAGPFKNRPAYDVSAELSVYVAPEAQGGGIGRALYEALETALAARGITNFYACVAYPREVDEHLDYSSVSFHEHMGYAIVGRFHGCARKFDSIYDMVWMEKLAE